MNKKSQEILDALAAKRKKSLARSVYFIYLHMHEWSRKRWAEDGWSDITMDHLKLISLIAGGEKMSNNELAKRAGVTKQAMSQMVTLMEKRGVLIVKPDPEDSRAKLISLSDYGVEFMLYFASCNDDLMKLYAKILGPEKTKTLTDLLSELTAGIQS